MAVLKVKTAGVTVVVNDVDHGPPHCHVLGHPGCGHMKVNIFALSVISPKGVELDGRVRARIRELRLDLLEAWSKVKRSPGKGG